MHETSLIVTLTVALAAGLVFGYITNLLRLSPIVGYLLAGVALGPFTPGFIADQQVAHELAEVGVMLLMFGVGLHFHLDDLLAVRRIAIPGAVAQIAVATMLGAVTARFLGLGWPAGIIYGLSLSVASTVVLTRILVDNRQLHTRTGHVSVGWLIVEDLFTVLALVVLPMVISGHAAGPDFLYALAGVTVKILALIAGTFILGMKIIPWVFTRVARSSSQELFTLTVLVTALGIAVSSAVFFDVSMALGAFLAGMVVGKSEFSLRAASEALPLRDAFAVLFFVSVGMLLDPSVLLDHAYLILATLAVVVLGKTLAAFFIILILGYPLKVALGVSVALAQIGEFSFILGSLGKELGVLDDLAINAIVATAIISITMNPVLFRLVPRLERWIVDTPWLCRLLTIRIRKQLTHPPTAADTRAPGTCDHAVIIGYGPVGRAVYKLLADNGIAATIIELNLETTRRLRTAGISVIYGDASRKEVLEGAGVSCARILILSASNVLNAEEIIRQARLINTSIRIIARTGYVRELEALKQAGCEAVFSGEGEVALALTEEVLRSLGATAEQIEKERSRVRKETIDGDGLFNSGGPG